MNRHVLEDFARYQRAKGLSQSTIDNRRYTLLALERAAGRSLLDVDIHDLRERIGRSELKKRSSMQAERNIYRAFFRFAKREGYRKNNPTKRLDEIRAPRGEARPYTLQQVVALLTTGAYFRTRAMILLGFYQGWRVGTIARAHGHDFDLEENTVRSVGKGNKVIHQPIHPVVRILATMMPRDDWWFPARAGRPGHIRSGSVSDLMTQAKRRAGIHDPDLTGHSLRHGMAVALSDSDVDVRVIQSLLGHATLATTQIYTRVSRRRQEAAVSTMPAIEIPTRSGRRAA